MKTSTIFTGVCLLLLTVTIAECGIRVRALDKKQENDCGDETDLNSELGKCIEAANDYDYDTACGDCRSVLEEYYECIGFDIGDEIEEACGGAPTVGAAVFSTVMAAVVAVAAAFN